MATNIIGLKELRLNTSKYIAGAQKGKSFTVVRRSKPIFKIVPVDEWGDEGTWESVANFSTMKGGGIPADQFLKLLKQHGQKTQSSLSHFQKKTGSALWMRYKK